MTDKHVKSCLVLLAMLGTGLPAHAGNLGTITVTPQGFASRTETSSRTVTIIDRETIESSHARDVVDLLRGQPNILVSDTSGVGAKSQVDLGGYGEAAKANSVVLIDGRRVNTPDLSGVDWSQIPLDQIERIEIVHGGGSVLYGDGAVGGVINIITRVPESGGRVEVSGGSFGSYSGVARAGLAGDRARVEINASGNSTDGYRDHNDYDRFDGGARAEADLTQNLSFYLKGNYHQDRADLPGALSAAEISVSRKQSTTPVDRARTTDSFIDGGLIYSGIKGMEVDLGGGFRRRESNSVFSSGSFDSTILTRSLRPRFTFTRATALKWDLLLGADIERINGATQSVFMGSTTNSAFDREHDGYFTMLGLGENRWRLHAGVRREHVRDDFHQQPSYNSSAGESVWETGASLSLTRQLQARLNVASSARFPLLDELTLPGTSPLVPQTGRHYSAGLRYTRNRGWLDVMFTRADLEDELFFNPIGGAFGSGANENYTDATRHDVFVVSANWALHRLAEVRASYTHTQATFEGGVFAGKRIPAVPVNRIGLDVNSDWGHGLGSSISLVYVDDAYLISDQANQRPKLPSYTLVNAVLRYQWQDLDMFVRIDNLLNRKYSSYGVFSSFAGTDNFYPAPELAVNAGVSYRF